MLIATIKFPDGTTRRLDTWAFRYTLPVEATMRGDGSTIALPAGTEVTITSPVENLCLEPVTVEPVRPARKRKR